MRQNHSIHESLRIYSKYETWNHKICDNTFTLNRETESRNIDSYSQSVIFSFINHKYERCIIRNFIYHSTFKSSRKQLSAIMNCKYCSNSLKLCTRNTLRFINQRSWHPKHTSSLSIPPNSTVMQLSREPGRKRGRGSPGCLYPLPPLSLPTT